MSETIKRLDELLVALIEEAGHSGAGLGDRDSVDEAQRAVVAFVQSLFTNDDFLFLCQVANDHRAIGRAARAEHVESLADRIAQLLPPEKP